jgi:hypothetical protein
MRNILYWCFDLFIIVCFMLFGMVIAEMHEYPVWIGALGGLVVHKLLTIILRTLRDYVMGGRS